MKTSNIAIALVLSGADTASASDPTVRELLSRIEALSSTVEALTFKATSLEETKSKSPEVPQSLRRLHRVGFGSEYLSSLSLSTPILGGDVADALTKCLDKQGRHYEEDCATAATAFAEAGIGGGRATLCFSEEETDLMVRADGGPGNGEEILGMEDFEGYFDFAPLSVREMQTVIVDVTASTGNLFFTGGDNEFDMTLADSVGGHTDTAAFYSNWNSVNDAKIFLGIELTPSGGGLAVNPVPEQSIPLMSKQDVFALDQDDWTADDDSFFFQTTETAISTGKFLFPNLPSGDYDVKVLVNIEGASELHQQRDEYEFSVVTKVSLGPHSIVATVVDGDDSQCNGIVWRLN